MIAVIHRGQKFKETMEAFQQKRAEFIAQEIRKPDKLSETLSKKYEKMFKKQNHEIVEEITPMI